MTPCGCVVFSLAAEKLGIALLILERHGPDEGLSLEQALTELRKRYGTEEDAHG